MSVMFKLFATSVFLAAINLLYIMWADLENREISWMWRYSVVGLGAFAALMLLVMLWSL